LPFPSWSTLVGFITSASVLMIGYVLIGVWMIYDKDRPPLDWKSAIWLPVYLIGMGIISWQGQFGPDNTGRIDFWLEMALVAAFSLGIYIWAYFTCLPREEMLNLISRQSGGDAPAEAETA